MRIRASVMILLFAVTISLLTSQGAYFATAGSKSDSSATTTALKTTTAVKTTTALKTTTTVKTTTTQSTSAQGSATQVSGTQGSVSIDLSDLKVQLTYPLQTQPGQSVTVNVQGRAENSFKLDSLLFQVYVANPNELLQIANVTVAQGLQMSVGGQINKVIQVAVPSSAQRTSLIAKLSENIDMGIFIVYNNVEAAPYYTTVSDDAIAPLTYIMATTPDYTSLQSLYQALQSNYNKDQQSLNQAQAQNQQLQTSITKQSAEITQQSDMINQLNQQLSSASTTGQTYAEVGIVAAVIAIIMTALAAFSIYRSRKKQKP